MNALQKYKAPEVARSTTVQTQLPVSQSGHDLFTTCQEELRKPLVILYFTLYL